MTRKALACRRRTIPESVCHALEPRRLLADVGIAVDTNFGAEGRTVADLRPRDAAFDAARLPDGRIVVVGATGAEDRSTLNNVTDGLLARFNPDGTPDAADVVIVRKNLGRRLQSLDDPSVMVAPAAMQGRSLPSRRAASWLLA